jgi:SAM-dependent methyltransferase
MQFKITSKLAEGFKENYERYMLDNFGKDNLPMIPHKPNGIFHNYRPWEYDKVFQYGDFQKDDLVLDTGAMHTYFSLYLAQFVKQIIATDNFYWAKRDYMEKEKLFTPEKWLEYIQKAGKGKIKGEEADLMKLTYPDNTFDKMLCISTVEHILDDAKAMQEMARVLKIGGRLLLTTEFNFFFPKDYTEKDNSFYRVYNLAQIKKLIKVSGLKLISPLVVENKRMRYILHSKKVNAFICLGK